VKFSYNWIRELVPGLDMSPAELTRLITMKTAECEGVAEYAPHLAFVVAARVLEAHKLEGTHLTRSIVDAGPLLGHKQVICGAPNCRADMTTAYVPDGVTLGDKEIRRTVIHGVESDGMLASGAELEINRDHAGILEFEAEPGEPVPGCFPDFVIEVDNKSLTHRPDLWGHHGMAREVAAITGQRLFDPVDLSLLPPEGCETNAWNAQILDYDACPRYSALVFDNVKVGPSPLWLQARLEAVGLNPISNIVDVTNLLLAGLSQPMHAFDAAKLHGKTIFVRHAKPGEVLAALNGESYTLNPANLVIADAEGAVALAGVIGGSRSAIGPGTTSIVLESANFEATGIRKTSSGHKLRTDASMRYEKAQDPINTTRALARAIILLEEVCPGIRVVGGLVDNWRGPEPTRVIELPLEWLVRKLGRSIEPVEVREILESLEFGVTESAPGVFSVTVPTWRATKDVTIKDDLLEEIGRMVGYATVPPVAPMCPATPPWFNAPRCFAHKIREACAAQGFTETLNYSFISEEMAQRFGLAPEAHLHVINPISSEQSLMRLSLLPGIHRNIIENAKRFDEFRLFEIGYEIHKSNGAATVGNGAATVGNGAATVGNGAATVGNGAATVRERWVEKSEPAPSAEASRRILPTEIPHLVAAIYSQGDGAAALYELKRLAECLMPGCEVTPVESRPYEHPARSVAVSWRGATLGRILELHPSLVETGRGGILDLDLEKLFHLGDKPKKYTPLQRYPSSAFDLSVITGLRELAGALRKKIRAAAGECCESVKYLYAYRGDPFPEDRQSLTYRVTLSAAGRTLAGDEAAAVRSAIIDALRADGYELRV
jgi:phenylalanyl-tRNA synthetase beta chain